MGTFRLFSGILILYEGIRLRDIAPNWYYFMLILCLILQTRALRQYAPRVIRLSCIRISRDSQQKCILQHVSSFVYARVLLVDMSC